MSTDDLDVLADRSHSPSVWRASVALLLGGVLLPPGARTSGTPCNSRKCGGPGTLPPFAVHMAIDGKRVPLSSHRTPIKIGRPVRIEVLFGTRQLDVSVTFELAGAGIGATAGQLQLVP
jgi:hypothetical protein